MRPLRCLLLLCSIAACTLAFSSASAFGDVECFGQQGCVSQAGPWVAVPGQTQPSQYQAMWGANCATGQLVGTDWNPDPNDNPYDLSVFVQQNPSSRIYFDSIGANFLVVNSTFNAESFQPLLGCHEGASARSSRPVARSSRAKRSKHRIHTHKLGPRRIRSFAHHCRKGERFVGSGVGVGFFKMHPPTDRELNDLHVRHEERSDSVHVTVRTGKTVGDNERVRIQIHTICR